MANRNSNKINAISVQSAEDMAICFADGECEIWYWQLASVSISNGYASTDYWIKCFELHIAKIQNHYLFAFCFFVSSRLHTFFRHANWKLSHLLVNISWINWISVLHYLVFWGISRFSWLYNRIASRFCYFYRSVIVHAQCTRFAKSSESRCSRDFILTIHRTLDFGPNSHAQLKHSKQTHEQRYNVQL